jgi:hypothetical protein
MLQKSGIPFKTPLEAAIAHLIALNIIKTSADVARDLGLRSRSTVSAYANGTTKMSDNFRALFETKYNINLKDFEHLAGEPKEGQGKKPDFSDQAYKDKYLKLLEQYNANSEELKEMIMYLAKLQKAEMEILLSLMRKQGDHTQQREILEKYELRGIFENTGK